MDDTGWGKDHRVLLRFSSCVVRTSREGREPEAEGQSFSGWESEAARGPSSVSQDPV